MKRFLPLCVLLIVFIGAAEAQITNCSQTLRLARSTYEQGRLHELPGLLEKCLKDNGFTQSEKIEAYKLLTLAYIYLEEPEKADETMLSLLRTDPYFVVNPEIDPAEFVGLYKTFRTHPIYRLGVKFGVNESQPNVLSYNPVSDGTGKYTSKIGIQFAIAGEVPITEKLTLNPELGFVSRSFNSDFNSFNDTETTPYSTTSTTEKQSWASLPVTLQYQIMESRVNPYVALGAQGDYLLSASLQGAQKRLQNQSIDVKSFDVTPQRQKINVSAVAAAGIKTRIAGGYLTAEVRYSYGVTKVNNASTLLANQYLLFDYKYTDGVYKLNSLSITIGYVQNFFNPKKLNGKK